LKKTLSQSTFVIVAHRFYPSIVDDLKRYLLDNRCAELWYVIHEFSTLKTRRSFYEHYRDGELVETHYGFDFSFVPDPFVNIKDFFYSMYWMLFKVPRGIDVFVGLGGFNALCGTLMRRIKKIRNVIFYTIDYVPVRFDNKLLNRLYHRIDRLEVETATETWNVSSRMAEGRERLGGLPQAKCDRQHVVPIGLWFEETPRYGLDEINRSELVFIGGVVEKHGVQVVIKAIPAILQKVAGFTFRIIGTGPYEGELKRLVEELGVQEHVIFEGGIPDQNVANEKLARAALAVAMYDRQADDYSYFADPGKLKTYLSAGLPILLTDLPHNAREIESRRCGRVLGYSEKDVAAVVIELMTDEAMLREYRENVLEYAREFDWGRIFESNLSRLP